VDVLVRGLIWRTPLHNQLKSLPNLLVGIKELTLEKMKYLTIDEFIKAQTEEDLWKIIEDYENWKERVLNFCW
jgi:hypothetical protein